MDVALEHLNAAQGYRFFPVQNLHSSSDRDSRESTDAWAQRKYVQAIWLRAVAGTMPMWHSILEVDFFDEIIII